MNHLADFDLDLLGDAAPVGEGDAGEELRRQPLGVVGRIAVRRRKVIVAQQFL